MESSQKKISNVYFMNSIVGYDECPSKAKLLKEGRIGKKIAPMLVT
jgi:hypothetical protein